MSSRSSHHLLNQSTSVAAPPSQVQKISRHRPYPTREQQQQTTQQNNHSPFVTDGIITDSNKKSRAPSTLDPYKLREFNFAKEIDRNSRDTRKARYQNQAYSTLNKEPTSALYASMSRIAPSEPIYLDLERDLAEEQMKTYGISCFNSTSSERPSAYEMARLRATRKSTSEAALKNVSSDLNRGNVQTRSYNYPVAPIVTPPSNHTPIFFHDPIDYGSVSTGISQQELLRKKARQDNKYKKEKKPGRKKKKATILNMPKSLIGSNKSNSNSNKTGSVGDVKSKVKSPIRLGGFQSKLQHKSLGPAASSSSDEMDVSTAETSKSGSGGSFNKTYQMPYSNVPAQSGVVNEADGAKLFEEWALRCSPSADHSVSEESFPILSKFGGRLNTLEAVKWEDEGASPADQVALAERRGVRFSSTLATSTHVYRREHPEAPWDERVDSSSPTSIAEQLPGPDLLKEDKFAIQNSATSEKENQSSSKPKSILRPARFTPTNGSSPNRIRRENEINKLSPPRDPINASVVRSPPNGSFVDRQGVEVSPIRKPPQIERSRQAMDMIPGELISDSENAAAFRSIVEKASMLYPDPPTILEESSLYSDPPLDMMEGSSMFDEEDTVMSAVGFIQSVAAIVIQTAFRRYAAMVFLEKKLLSVSGYPKKEYQIARRNSDHYREELVSAKDEILEMQRQLEVESQQKMGRQVEPQLDKLIQKEKSIDAENVIHASGENSEKAVSQAVPRDLMEFENMEKRMYEMAAILIQSVFRGFWVRDCASVDNYCAKVIQTAYRGFHYRMQYNFDIYRIVLVQSIWRRNMAFFEAEDRIAATIYLQAVFRGCRLRKHLKTLSMESAQVRYSAKSVRSAERKERKKKSFRFSHRELKYAAATIIQAAWRMYWCELNFIKTLVDVLVVQSTARRWLARRYLESLRLQKVARTRFQHRSGPNTTGVWGKSKLLSNCETPPHLAKHNYTETSSAPHEPSRFEIVPNNLDQASFREASGKRGSDLSERSVRVTPPRHPKMTKLNNPSLSDIVNKNSAGGSLTGWTDSSSGESAVYGNDDAPIAKPLRAPKASVKQGRISLGSSGGCQTTFDEWRSDQINPRVVIIEDDDSPDVKNALSNWKGRDKKKSSRVSM